MNMNKGRKLLRFLGTLVTNPRRILRLVDDEELSREYVHRKYGVQQLPTVDFLEMVPNLDTRITRYSFLDGTSTIPDIVLLKSLAQQFSDCVYLEIGSWRGESLANVAEVAKKCYSLTLSEAEMRQRDFPEKFIDVHGFFSKDLGNVQTFAHDSATFDFSLIQDRCDLIFVDGDHSYAGVKTDTANVLRLLRDDRSIIVWHDYGYSAESTRPSVLAGILDGLPRELHRHLYHVSNTMCAVLCRREFKSQRIWSFPETPNKSFQVSVTAQAI
jgi:hypothetical protein